jgi:hypothetical protein
MELQPATIAVRLADEGVPLMAIARATTIPLDKVYEMLIYAKMRGQLLTMPKNDWPPGCPRDQRSLQLSRLITENHDTLMHGIQDYFSLTPVPAKLLLLLVQHEQVPHARIDIEHKAFAVHVCKMRHAMRKHGIKIITLWGYGYKLNLEHRKKAMELILNHLGIKPQ